MEPKVSIVILNWNGKNDLLECLDSVDRIEYSNFEVIVIDNGSVDGSVEALRQRFNKAIIIENKENTGFCRGNNIGISLALERGAEYLLILNNDTLVEPLILKELQGAVSREQDKTIVNPLIAYWQDRRQIHWLGAKIDWGNAGLYARRQEKDCLLTNELQDSDFVSWCAAFFSRQAIEATGYLDEAFFAYYEDIDWSLRAKKKGFKTMIFPKVLVYHKCSRSSGGVYSPTVYFFIFRNKFVLMHKHARVLRKLQFSFNYVTDALEKYAELSELGNPQGAVSVINGLWSALTGNFFNKKEVMSERIKRLPVFLKKAYLYYKTIRNIF